MRREPPREEPLVPRLLSQREAATYLGISYWMLRDLVFRGELPSVRIRRRVLIDRVDVDRYLGQAKKQLGA
jgi:excisionase family DNA binding protein